MKITHKGKEYNLRFNEYGAMFAIEDSKHRVVEWMCSRRAPDAGFNQSWVLAEFAQTLINAEVVSATGQVFDDDCERSFLCNIIHPLFNDGGYSPFGDFCRSRLGQQCQYGSRYIDGRLEGYPELGKGLRFNNGMGYHGQVRPLNASDYHSVRIHRDDMDEFERRYKEYQTNRISMFDFD